MHNNILMPNMTLFGEDLPLETTEKKKKAMGLTPSLQIPVHAILF